MTTPSTQHGYADLPQETFGPVVSIIEVDDADEAVAVANDTEYGLAASVFSGDARRALQVADGSGPASAMSTERPCTTSLRCPSGVGRQRVGSLRVHALYTRIEVLSALGAGAGSLTPSAWQSGVRREASVPADVCAFTLDKSRGGCSPTRYRAAALSPELLHWESQTAASAASETGQPYLHHQEIGSHILLFAGLDVSTMAFWYLGPATYVRHEGDRPIAITWRLHHRLRGDLYTAFAAAVA